MGNEVIPVFFITDRRNTNFSTRHKYCKMKSTEKDLTIVRAMKENYLAKFLTGKMIRWHIFLYQDSA